MKGKIVAVLNHIKNMERNDFVYVTTLTIGVVGLGFCAAALAYSFIQIVTECYKALH